MSNLDERTQRLYLASEADSLGRGGVTVVSRLAGVDRHTISKGIKEIKNSLIVDGDGKHKTANIEGTTQNGKQRVRKKGGGRKPITETDPGIVEALLALVDNESYGNPENPLRWTCKSTRLLAEGGQEHAGQGDVEAVFLGHDGEHEAAQEEHHDRIREGGHEVFIVHQLACIGAACDFCRLQKEREHWPIQKCWRRIP